MYIAVQTGALQSAIFNSANFSSIATDAHGVIQIFNVGAERILGYLADSVGGMNDDGLGDRGQPGKHDVVGVPLGVSGP